MTTTTRSDEALAHYHQCMRCYYEALDNGWNAEADGLLEDAKRLHDEYDRALIAEATDELTDSTICQRCEEQIAIDNMQFGSLLCDDCIIATTPEPGDAKRCEDCGDLTDFIGDVKCAKCAYRRAQESDRALYQRMDDGFRKQQYLARAIGLFALALALIAGAGSASAAEVPAFVTNVPDGCAVTMVFEDHSAIATCAGSYIAGFDPDDGSWDIPVAVDTLVLTDADGGTHEFPLMD